MKNCSMILIEKLQKYQHYHQVKLIREILPPDQSRVIEQAKFTYSHSEKALDKQTKKLKIKKQIKAIENRAVKQLLETGQKLFTHFFSKDFFSEEASYELNKIEQENNRDDIIYKTGNKRRDKTYYFRKFKTRSFGREIYSDSLSKNNALEE